MGSVIHSLPSRSSSCEYCRMLFEKSAEHKKRDGSIMERLRFAVEAASPRERASRRTGPDRVPDRHPPTPLSRSAGTPLSGKVS